MKKKKNINSKTEIDLDEMSKQIREKLLESNKSNNSIDLDKISTKIREELLSRNK